MHPVNECKKSRHLHNSTDGQYRICSHKTSSDIKITLSRISYILKLWNIPYIVVWVVNAIITFVTHYDYLYSIYSVHGMCWAYVSSRTQFCPPPTVYAWKKKKHLPRGESLSVTHTAFLHSTFSFEKPYRTLVQILRSIVCNYAHISCESIG